jgi:ribonucleoside-diphosphate reductase beta chain
MARSNSKEACRQPRRTFPVSATRPCELLPGYLELYRRWERQPWQVYALDFRPDRQQWRGALPAQREAWYRLARLPGFYQGELSVAEALGPFLTAMPHDDQRLVLATQIADEARHVVFFERFYREVLGFAPHELGEGLPAEHQSRSPAFVHIALERLPAMARRLRENPRDDGLLVEGVTLYHLIVESVLALDHQRLVLRELKQRELFPGFCTGFAALCRDEVRHVLFGMRFLRDMVRKDPAHGAVVSGCVAGLLPLLSQIWTPPGGNSATHAGGPGSFGKVLRSLERRLQVIGVTMTRQRAA